MPANEHTDRDMGSRVRRKNKTQGIEISTGQRDAGLALFNERRTIAKIKTDSDQLLHLAEPGEFAGLRPARLVAAKRPDLIVTIHERNYSGFIALGKYSFLATFEKD